MFQKKYDYPDIFFVIFFLVKLISVYKLFEQHVTLDQRFN